MRRSLDVSSGLREVFICSSSAGAWNSLDIGGVQRRDTPHNSTVARCRTSFLCVWLPLSPPFSQQLLFPSPGSNGAANCSGCLAVRNGGGLCVCVYRACPWSPRGETLIFHFCHLCLFLFFLLYYLLLILFFSFGKLTVMQLKLSTVKYCIFLVGVIIYIIELLQCNN